MRPRALSRLLDAACEGAKRITRAKFMLTFGVADLQASFAPVWELRKSTPADRWPEKILPKPPRPDQDCAQASRDFRSRARRISAMEVFVFRRA